MTAANQIVRSAKKVLAMEGRPHMTTFAPILISFSFRLVSDQSLIGSGVASVRRKFAEIVGERVKLKANRIGRERAA